MKHKSIQAFTTFDFIVTAASFTVIIAVSLPIIQKNLQSGNIEKAQKETHQIAFDLLNSQETGLLRIASTSSQKLGQGRAVASVDRSDVPSMWTGQAKQDPWGTPYHFRFLRNSKGMPVQLVVWSEGPDKKTSQPTVKVSSADGLEHMEFAADDVVATIPLR